MSTDPARWLIRTTRTGITELPANAGWLLRKAFSEPGGSKDSTGDGVRARARRAREAVADSVPLGADSLELRMRRAHEALERARQAERDAVEAAQKAKDVAQEADETAQRVADAGRRLRRTATPR